MRILLLLVLTACGDSSVAAAPSKAAAPAAEGLAVAVFAGGCFWCMEAPFEKLAGVVSVESGYTGGPEIGPTYHAVARGATGHFEAIRVVFRPDEVGYSKLLSVFWHNVDPTQANGQFCDKGDQYRTAIFVGTPGEKTLAESSKKMIEGALERPVVTPVLDASTFWLAEDYHQDFYKKNPTRYYSYRAGCGRDKRLEQLWGNLAGS